MLKSRSLDKQFNPKSATNLPLIPNQGLDCILSRSIKLGAQTTYENYLYLISDKHYMPGQYKDILDICNIQLDIQLLEYTIVFNILSYC